VFTKRNRKEAEVSTSASTLTRPSKRENHAGIGGSAEQGMAADRAFLRMGAVSMVLGLLLSIGVGFFHGGTPPEDLRAVLPQVAANDYWVGVHLAQFVGDVLMLFGFVALYRSITQGASAGASVALARMGIVGAVVAEGVYAVNQAVDGIANKFVAQEWVSAAPAEKADAFRLANAVRHIEIGTSSLWLLSGGITLLLFGLAIALGSAYPRFLGWIAITVGAGQVVGALNLAYNGFSGPTSEGPLTLVFMATSLISLLLTPLIAFYLWRKAGGSGWHDRPQP
jgi:hypothetical protein